MTDLNKMLFGDGKEKGCDKIDIGFGLSISKFIAQDSANKLDSREQTVTGEITDKMQKSLDKSKWKRLRKRLGKKLSLYGEAALAIDIINDEPFISISDLVQFRELAGDLVEVVLQAEGVVEVDGYDGSFPIYERFFFEGGRVVKYNAIKVEDEWIIQGDKIIFPENITKIPVKIFVNNEDAVSDIDNTNMWGAISLLNNMTNDIKDTSELSQIGLLVNRNMTGGKSAQEIMKSYKDKKYIETSGIDSQLGAGVQPIGSMGYVTELLMSIEWIEDKIFKYTFTTRDSTSTGSNKHNAEIGMFNQFAIEYLIDKKEIREEDYADFYSLLSMVAGTPTKYTVTLQISEVLQNMLDAMNPETPKVQENINEDKTSKDDKGAE